MKIIHEYFKDRYEILFTFSRWADYSVKLVEQIGFESKHNLSYYLWLCELQQWVMHNYNIIILLEPCKGVDSEGNPLVESNDVDITYVLHWSVAVIQHLPNGYIENINHEEISNESFVEATETYVSALESGLSTAIKYIIDNQIEKQLDNEKVLDMFKSKNYST